MKQRGFYVITDKRKEPVLESQRLGPPSYTPGFIAGTAYLYSFSQKRIACVGPITATSSAKAEFRFSYRKGNVLDENRKRFSSAEAALYADMSIQIRRAIAVGLHAAQAPDR